MKIWIIWNAMISIIQMLAFFWLIRTMKFVLFWIYLWQLKEYHVGRFLDHFNTYKGKKLLFGNLPIFKFILLFFLLTNHYYFPLVFYILLLDYITESTLFIINILRKNLKIPKFTFKTLFLVLISFILTALFLSKAYNLSPQGGAPFAGKESFSFTFSILVFDIFIPLIISFIVLFFQPFFVLTRNRILKKAKEKIKKFPNLIIIGITGSYGKTSTKEFLATILASKFNVLSTKDHQNSEIGIAKCILNDLNKNHQIFVVEMGSYKKGGISLLCDIVKPKIGIVTGVNEQHLALFGSMENLLSAEGGRELLKSLPKNGMIVVNGDNKYCLNLYKLTEIKKRVYTLHKDKIDSDIWTEDIVVEKKSISFIAMTREKSRWQDYRGSSMESGEMAHFDINILGKQNAQNILGAILVAKELGMSLEEIALACKNITQKQAGITIKNGVHGIDIIDSSYSSNPDGVMADLDYLNIFPQKKIIVMPCLIELDNESDEIHREIGKKIAEVCDMVIITTKEKFEEIKSRAMTGGMPQDNIKFSENPKEIFNIVTTFCKSGDAVLLEGRVPHELIRLLMR